MLKRGKKTGKLDMVPAPSGAQRVNLPRGSGRIVGVGKVEFWKQKRTRCPTNREWRSQAPEEVRPWLSIGKNGRFWFALSLGYQKRDYAHKAIAWGWSCQGLPHEARDSYTFFRATKPGERAPPFQGDHLALGLDFHHLEFEQFFLKSPNCSLALTRQSGTTTKSD